MALCSALLLVCLSLPYAYGVAVQGTDHVFGGLLINPIDGNSYFAKMQAGARGEWTFRLPYTADPGPGVPLFGYYLFLGHVARGLGAPIPVVYHVARIIGGAVLLFTAYALVARVFDAPSERLGAWSLIVLGSGLGGWAVAFGAFTSDLWVAEGFPFLAAYATPHFPLATAAVLWTYLTIFPNHAAGEAGRTWAQVGVGVAAAGLLVILLPPVVAGVGLVVAGSMLADGWSRWRRREALVRLHWAPALAFCAVAAAGLGLVYWSSRAHPTIAQWSAQNMTLSPPVWDYLIAYGLLGVPALLGIRAIVRGESAGSRWLLLWAGLNVFALYLPVPFQRRLTTGLFVCLAVLAALGLRAWAAGNVRRWWLGIGALLLLGLPTQFMVLLAGVHGARSLDPRLYLTRGEYAAMAWMRQNLPADAVVLAGPQTGLFVPAHAGVRVLYGHPFETVDASQRKAEVEQFFSGEVGGTEAQAILDSSGADYVFVGPREMEAGALLPVTGLRVVYVRDGIALYAVEG